MFYLLYRQFDINIFQYITVRAGIGFFIAFLLTVFLMPKFIAWAKSKKANQPIYELAPQSHKSKSNTPTMGGIVFLFSTIIATLLSVKLNNIYTILGLFTIGAFGYIGFTDDYSKITNGKNEFGLSAKMKLILQFAFAFVVAIALYLYGFDSGFYVPFYKYEVMQMGILATFFWALVIVSSSNAVNLTDGLDGLATVPSIFSLASLGTLVYITGNFILSRYLLLPYVPEIGEVAIIGASLAGALMGFLWFNSHPAEVFMGDSGSLTLGAFIGYLAIISKSEILLLLIGFIFVLETVSVIIQVASYKTRKKRIFLMAPIHHHFEMKGWAENKVIVRFWIIAFISNLIAIITIKIR